MDLLQGIVGIVAKPSLRYKFSGTGFFVDGEFILTCAHVIEDAEKNQDGYFYFFIEGQLKRYTAGVVFTSSKDDGVDFCVLKPVDLNKDVPGLPLVASRQSEGHAFKTFGYPQEGEFNGLPGHGKIDIWVRDILGHDALYLKSDNIAPGFSGCPIWDKELNGVVGMLSRGFKPNATKYFGNARFAIPSEVLKNTYQSLKLHEAEQLKPVNPKRARKRDVESQKLTDKKLPGDYNTINTEYAISDFCEMLNPESNKRIMHIWGDSMMGKSHLTEKVFPLIARNAHVKIIASRIEFAGFEGDEIDLMCQIMALFPDPKSDCPSFTQQRESFLSFLEQTSKATISQSNAFDFRQRRSDHCNAMALALVSDLRKHEDAHFVFLFDAVNNIPSGLRDWLLKKFIIHISQLRNIRVVITSKEPVDLSYIQPHLCLIHRLQVIQNIKPFVEYCQRHDMHIKIHEIRTIVYAARFNPGQFLILANEFKKSKESVTV